MEKVKAFASRTWRELRYIPHIMFHPFDGFWDLKHEKRGSFSTAVILLVLWMLSVICTDQFTGFILNYVETEKVNLFFRSLNVLLPFMVWTLSNWCITTLMEGEGTLKDIFITTAYASAPYSLIQFLLIPLSNFITLDESAFYTLFQSLGLIWFAFLFFCGLSTVHQFTPMKTVFTIILAFLGLVIILFLVMLFLYLVQSVISFVWLLLQEYHLHLNQ